MVFFKIIDDRELEFTQKSSEAGISPPIISVNKINKYDSEVTFDHSGPNLYRYFHEGKPTEKYEKSIEKQIKSLHGLGILHGNLTAENILIEPNRNKVFLIGYNSSYYLDDITSEDLEDLYASLDPDDIFESVEDVEEHEYDMYKKDLISNDLLLFE